jgi:hypothetical protein
MGSSPVHNDCYFLFLDVVFFAEDLLVLTVFPFLPDLLVIAFSFRGAPYSDGRSFISFADAVSSGSRDATTFCCTLSAESVEKFSVHSFFSKNCPPS